LSSGPQGMRSFQQRGEELRRILGDFVLLEYRNPIETGKELLDIIREVRPDIVIVRAPIPVIASLLELGREYGFELWEEEMESVGHSSHRGTTRNARC